MYLTSAEGAMKILWWLTATALIAGGILIAEHAWWATLAMVPTGVISLPVIYDRITKKTQLNDRVNVRIPLVFITLFSATVLSHVQQVHNENLALAQAELDEQYRIQKLANDRAQLTAKNKADAAAEFERSGDQILADLDAAITAKNLEAANKLVNRFQPAISDPRFIAQRHRFDALQREVQLNKSIAALESQLAYLKIDQYSEAGEIFRKLQAIAPDNAIYKAKADRLAKIRTNIALRAARERVQADELAKRKKQIESQFSSWDGSHRTMERLIKSVMNDPDSYEHVETRYSDLGSKIRVSTVFRGKNAFGGTVRNTKVAEFDLNGNFLHEIQ